MVPQSLLLVLLLAEAVLLGAALLVLFTSGLLTSRRHRRRPRTRAVEEILADAVLRDDGPPDILTALGGLRRREQVRLFVRLGSSLRGRERNALRELARTVGLHAYAKSLCRSRLWWRRLRGVRVLGLVGGGEDWVLALAGDREPLVREQVAHWCGEHPSPAAVLTLIGKLADPSRASRFAVQNALCRIGVPAVEPLIARLRTTRDPAELLAGLGVARAVGDARLAPVVVERARSRDPRVRRAACRALGRIGGEAAEARLLERLTDDEAVVAGAAAAALGELGHWPAAPTLARLLASPSWDVRSRAAAALVRMGAPGELVLRMASRSSEPVAADMARHALDTAAVTAAATR